MSKTPRTIIVIPCYNEEIGITIKEYSFFLEANSEVLICFVNDGSTDSTLLILKSLRDKYPNQIHILSQENKGKAEAVRSGVIYCNLTFNHQYIGYLDADLATTLEEFMDLEKYLIGDISFSFGSRIRKIGSTIERETSRFLVGRIIATFISLQLNLKVYDTQCGSKLFTKNTSKLLFEEKFISKWLFDVELFHRMIRFYGKENAVLKMYEVPLKKWVEKGNSKVKLTYIFKLWFDLYEISSNYKK